MTDATIGTPLRAPTPDEGLREADVPLTDADGTPLKKSLSRALRREKMRALMLIAPLLLFILITFIAPIADMLFRSVENQIVADTLPRTVAALDDWNGEGLPDDNTLSAFVQDLVVSAERKTHTRLGTRLNYELSGISSLFRRAGRGMDDVGEVYRDQFEELNEAWEKPETWTDLFAAPSWYEARNEVLAEAEDADSLPRFELRDGAADVLPRTADAYAAFARTIQQEGGDDPVEEEPWAPVYLALYQDLSAAPDLSAWDGPRGDLLAEAAAAVTGFESVPMTALLEEIDEDWLDPAVWRTIKTYSGPYTAGYFANSVDLQMTDEGIAPRPENERVYVMLFQRTLIMSLVICGSCILLGYPIAYLLANLPLRSANLLMILVLLPFWTSLLVRTSAWKVLLQQQGVINDTLVWLGLVSDANRLALINNQTGTIIAMTHILLPFMILPLYSVMKTIPPSYMRAAKSLGANDWTAFWRVYFPNSMPGIGAGSILVFILSIGYYITPELVGGTSGVFISNRIAYHISSSLNWGLAAALGSILLVAVLILYWAYDKLVGIDNVKLGG